MFSQLNEQILITPCSPAVDRVGGLIKKWGEPKNVWASITFCNINFKKPGIPLWPPLPSGRVTGCYQIIIRYEEVEIPLGRISWNDKTLYPIDMPSPCKDKGYLMFKAVEIGGGV